MTSNDYEIRDIVCMLTGQIERLASEVLPLGHRDGNDWVDAKTSQGGIGDSMRVCIRGHKRGIFYHFAASTGGDALSLISYVLYNGDIKLAVKYAKDWLGLAKANPEEIKQARKNSEIQRKKKEREDAKTKERRRKFAHSLWLLGKPIIDTPVEAYLKGRAIDLRSLGKVPGALRYLPDHKHFKTGKSYPVMLGAIIDGAGQFCAVHRTFLQVHKDGRVTKDQELGHSAKLVLGSYDGGFIALARGKSRKPLKQAPSGDKIILCEGIEDALSIAVAKPDRRVLAAVSVNNFSKIVLPPQIKNITIAADNDPKTITKDGRDYIHPARRALNKAVQIFNSQGCIVRVACSKSGKDFNDVLRGEIG